MQNYKQQFQNKFKDKKITVMGLGLLGRGIGYTKFLAECGADLVVTDLKTKDQLTTSLKQLSRFKNITYVLGRHRLEDFNGRDMIIKAPGVPLDSIYILEAKKNNIPVEMDVSLFAKCAPEVMIDDCYYI
jgi:UDP-N-acetylmuramoylalanine--D-glutamate ligase